MEQYSAYPSVLYVWSGQDKTVSNAADFVAVVDFDEASKTYGQILKIVSLKSDHSKKIKPIGNEPYHSSISSDGKYFITGGLLSFVSKQKEIFVWSIPSNPSKGPKFLYALDISGACPHEFLPIGDAKFIVSMMCNESAVSPGDIALIDASTGTHQFLVKDKSSFQNFNPHGFDRLENGSLFAADYAEPITLTNKNKSKIVFRNTIRHILPDGTLERIFNFDDPRETNEVGQGIGFMELKTIPNDPFGRSFTCGSNTNKMYLVGPGMSKPKMVYDLSKLNGYKKAFSAGITSIFPNSKRLIMTFQMRYIILFNITNPLTPSILQYFDFCTDEALVKERIQISNPNQTMTFAQFCKKNNNTVGSHVLVHPKGENRFLIVNYFVKFGLTKFSGTRSLHAFKFNQNLTSFKYDSRFNPNFQFDKHSSRRHQTFHSLKAYPRHLQYLKLGNKR